MNKSELIKQIADRAGLSQAKAGDALDAFCASVIDALSQGSEVAIIGFGTFKVSDRAERKGRNPQTGEAITIPASQSPKFSAGKALKDAVR
jgi:DNA-binding protein HU-beta, NS1